MAARRESFPEHPHMVDSLRELVRLYEAWDKRGEAATWRAKLPDAEGLDEQNAVIRAARTAFVAARVHGTRIRCGLEPTDGRRGDLRAIF